MSENAIFELKKNHFLAAASSICRKSEKKHICLISSLQLLTTKQLLELPIQL